MCSILTAVARGGSPWKRFPRTSTAVRTRGKRLPRTSTAVRTRGKRFPRTSTAVRTRGKRFPKTSTSVRTRGKRFPRTSTSVRTRGKRFPRTSTSVRTRGKRFPGTSTSVRAHGKRPLGQIKGRARGSLRSIRAPAQLRACAHGGQFFLASVNVTGTGKGRLLRDLHDGAVAGVTGLPPCASGTRARQSNRVRKSAARGLDVFRSGSDGPGRPCAAHLRGAHFGGRDATEGMVR